PHDDEPDAHSRLRKRVLSRPKPQRVWRNSGVRFRRHRAFGRRLPLRTSRRIGDRSMRVAPVAILLPLLFAACARVDPETSVSAPPPAPDAMPAVLPPAGTAVPPVAKTPAAAPALDLNTLETRLRETKAIGIFTKISLKNLVD